jgi:hypothetical protein
MKALSPEILKARLRVALAYSSGQNIMEAIAAWSSTEPVDDERVGLLLLEAVAQIIGDDRAMALVLFASSSFRLELAEVVDGRL